MIMRLLCPCNFTKIFILLITSVLSTGYAQQADLPDNIRQYLNSHAYKWNLTESDLSEMKIKDHYTSAHNGLTHYYFQQVHQGIEIYQGIFTLAVDRKGKVVNANSRFVSNIAETIGNNPKPLIEPIRAVREAANHLTLTISKDIRIEKQFNTPDQAVLINPAGISEEAIPVKLVIEPGMNDKALLCWYVNIKGTDDTHWWNVRVDAKDASVVSVDDWVNHDHWGKLSKQHNKQAPAQEHVDKYKVETETITKKHSHDVSFYDDNLALTSAADGASYEVFPLGVESPSHGERIIVADPSDPVASPFGWHDVDGEPGADFSITRGNNVWAREDRDANNVQGEAATGGSDLSFQFAYGDSALPSENLDASLTNLFYWGNIIHDIWYQYGFDEVSGNFQSNNYGKGGSENDFVFIDALDGSGFNNANFTPPPDGQNGRMQMFIWTADDGQRKLLEVFSPGPLIGKYTSTPASFGPALITNPVDGQVVLVNDTSSNPEFACTTLINAEEINGKIALLSRGDCLFTEKVKRVQEAGAIGVIVGNNQAGAPIVMGGDDNTITIPAIMVTQEDYEMLRSAASNLVVNLSFEELPSDKDSGFDNGIIAHEYGHGISTRLTGGPSTNCLGNDEQMGEGWSDWIALVMTVKEGDLNVMPRPIATFPLGEPTTGGGIRTFPYSTDMNINPHTYDDIRSESIPHGVGSVWGAMLWDMYWALIDRYGYDSDLYNGDGGNNVAMQLVIDGMKLQPCSPGFIDGRDAILLADSINYGGANQCIIWEAFARRGLGFSASQGSSVSVTDGQEAFDLPSSCKEALQLFVDAEVDSIPGNGVLTYQYTVANTTENTLTSIAVFDTLNIDFNYLPDPQDCGFFVSDSVLTFTIPSLAAGDTFTCDLNIQVNAPTFSTTIFQEAFEGAIPDWQEVELSGSDGWRSRVGIGRNGSSAYFVPNAPRENDQTLITPPLTLPENAELSFWHTFDTEFRWDGGVVEFQVDRIRAQWEDIQPHIVEGEYPAFLGDNNPAGSRPAFTGNSEGFIRTRVDLSEFAGESVRFRFRMLSDNNTAGTGWTVDDVRLTDRISVINRAFVISNEGDTDTDSENVAVSTFTTSISNLAEELNIAVYPNPAQDQVRISWGEVQNNDMEIKLVNMVGQSIMETSISGQREAMINVSRVPAGVYFVEFRQGERSGAKKLIIQ